MAWYGVRGRMMLASPRTGWMKMGWPSWWRERALVASSRHPFSSLADPQDFIRLSDMHPVRENKMIRLPCERKVLLIISSTRLAVLVSWPPHHHPHHSSPGFPLKYPYTILNLPRLNAFPRPFCFHSNLLVYTWRSTAAARVPFLSFFCVIISVGICKLETIRRVSLCWWNSRQRNISIYLWVAGCYAKKIEEDSPGQMRAKGLNKTLANNI